MGPSVLPSHRPHSSSSLNIRSRLSLITPNALRTTPTAPHSEPSKTRGKPNVCRSPFITDLLWASCHEHVANAQYRRPRLGTMQWTGFRTGQGGTLESVVGEAPSSVEAGAQRFEPLDCAYAAGLAK